MKNFSQARKSNVNPFLTIVTPTFNRGYLLDRIASNLLELDKLINLQWILVDDGSNDNTQEKAAGYSAGLHCFRFIKQPNAGKHSAINRAIPLVSGEWVCEIDSDDIILDVPQFARFIQVELAKLSQTTTALIVPRKTSSPKNKKIKWEQSERILNYNEFLHQYIWTDTTMFIRRNAYQKHKFPVFKGEKYIAEEVRYIDMFCDKSISVKPDFLIYTEYRRDGLSRNSIMQRSRSPRGAVLTYKKKLRLDQGLANKIRCKINLARFTLHNAFRTGNLVSLRFTVYILFGICFFVMDICLIKIKGRL